MSVSDIVDKDKSVTENLSDEKISETPRDLLEKVAVSEDKQKFEEDLRNKASELEKEKKKFHEEKMEFEEKMKKTELELQTKLAEFERDKRGFEQSLEEFKAIQEKFASDKKKI